MMRVTTAKGSGEPGSWPGLILATATARRGCSSWLRALGSRAGYHTRGGSETTRPVQAPPRSAALRPPCGVRVVLLQRPPNHRTSNGELPEETGGPFPRWLQWANVLPERPLTPVHHSTS